VGSDVSTVFIKPNDNKIRFILKSIVHKHTPTMNNKRKFSQIYDNISLIDIWFLMINISRKNIAKRILKQTRDSLPLYSELAKTW
jgi:hypothetical protein